MVKGKHIVEVKPKHVTKVRIFVTASSAFLCRQQIGTQKNRIRVVQQLLPASYVLPNVVFVNDLVSTFWMIAFENGWMLAVSDCCSVDETFSSNLMPPRQVHVSYPDSTCDDSALEASRLKSLMTL